MTDAFSLMSRGILREGCAKKPSAENIDVLPYGTEETT